MKNVHLKAFVYLFLFLLLDMSFPIGFLSGTDLTMLGVVFLSVYLDYRLVLLYALFFGTAKDALNSHVLPFFSIDFIITVFLVKSLLKYFRDKLLSKFIIVFLAVLFNFVFITAFSGANFSLHSLLAFVLCSLGVLFFTNYFFAVWIQQ